MEDIRIITEPKTGHRPYAVKLRGFLVVDQVMKAVF